MQAYANPLRPGVFVNDGGAVQWALVEAASTCSAFALHRLLDILLDSFGREGLEGTVAVQQMGTDIRPHFLVGLRKVPACHRGAVARHLLQLRERTPANFLYYMYDAAAGQASLLRVDPDSRIYHDVDLASPPGYIDDDENERS